MTEMSDEMNVAFFADWKSSDLKLGWLLILKIKWLKRHKAETLENNVPRPSY